MISLFLPAESTSNVFSLMGIVSRLSGMIVLEKGPDLELKPERSLRGWGWLESAPGNGRDGKM